MNSITKKWLRGSLLTTLLVLLLAEGLFLFQSYNLYYGGVRQAVNSRFASISGQLKMYTGDEKATQSQRRSQALRRMVEQFDEKDKFEFTLLDAGGQVLASSSGRAGELSSLEDFQQAMASPDGRGEAIYRSVAGERVLAITILTPYQAEDIAALRLVTSLTLVDEQVIRLIWISLGVAAAVLAFIACGTYETGYVYAVLALLLWVVYTRSVWGGLRASAPALGGMAVAFCFHFASSRHGGTGNELSLDIPNVARVTVQQMAASIPFLGPWLQGQDCGTISKGDMLWPFVLGLLAVAALLFAVPREKVSGKSLGGLALLGLGLWAAPAALLALSARYQQPEAITWKWGYIPAAASSVGLGLLLAAGVAALAELCCRLPKVPSAVLRALLAVVLAAGIAANGAFTRGCLRTHHAENLKAYNFFADTIRAGLADEVTADDLILCNENVWDTNTQAETNFFCRFAGRELHAQMPGIELPAGHGTLYAYQTYRNYGGYDLAWCGRLTDDTGEVMDGMRVYVQGALVPDNAVIKYKVRLADGTEEARQICLLDCDRTPRNEKGEYIATVEDTSILNAKVMIWDG